jgi:hypothetical protein
LEPGLLRAVTGGGGPLAFASGDRSKMVKMMLVASMVQNGGDATMLVPLLIAMQDGDRKGMIRAFTGAPSKKDEHAKDDDD